MRVCLARERPIATGSTASRWDGLETRCMLIARPSGARYSPVAPMWYFTSPPPSTLRGFTSSKRAKISAGERPTMLVITFRRPRSAREDLGRRAAHDVGHHVQAAAMAHREHAGIH